MIGNKDPAEAKSEKFGDAEVLRATYGADLIRNGFHGSDNPKAANKERDIFLFPIPEKPPDFEYIRTKVTIDMILSFMFPPNLEHSNSTGRLDLFALFGLKWSNSAWIAGWASAIIFDLIVSLTKKRICR